MPYALNPFTGKLDNTGSATGTVTTLSVVTNQGVSGSVANPTTTPAITLSLGALTGATSYNGLVVTANTGTITTGVWNGTAVGVANGGTGVATFASNGVLYGNGTTSVLVTAQGIANSILTANAGAPIFSDAPIIGTSITCPTHYGSSSSGGNLVLQSTSNATRGLVQVEDLAVIGTSVHNFGATTNFYIDVATGGCTITTGAMTALRCAPTLTCSGNSSSTLMALFNDQVTIQDDGTGRTVGPSLILSSNSVYKTTVASGLTVNDLAGLPGYIGLYFALTANRSGVGTGTMTTAAGIYISTLSNIGTGWTLTNYCGMLIDKPGTITGTLTNFYGVKNNGVAATNHWFLYETGGMQSSHKGSLRLGDNTAPTTLLDIAGTLTMSSGGKVTRYNNVATTGWGSPAVYGTGRSTAQTGDVASVAAYTMGAADGSVIVSCNLLMTAFTAGTQSVQIAYTDEGSTARTLTLTVSSVGGALGTTIGATGAFEGVPLHLRCKASTAITIKTVGTAFTGTYNVEGNIMQIA